MRPEQQTEFLAMMPSAATTIALPWLPLGLVPHAGAQPRRGGTLKLLVDPEPTTLVALTNSADPSMLVSAKVTGGLLTYDFDLEPKPQLATGWSVSRDGTEYTFRLRAGVEWEKGSRIVYERLFALPEAHHSRPA